MSDNPNRLQQYLRATAVLLLSSKIQRYFQPNTREEALSAIDAYMQMLKNEMIEEVNFRFDVDEETKDMFPPVA